MSGMKDDVVLVECRGSTLWITITREERRNAINTDVLLAIEHALASVNQRPDLRAVVLTAAGQKAFCAGADLRGGTGVFAEDLDEPTTDFGRLARVARGVGVPLVARINGDCVAGGMALLSICDLAVCASHARFGLPEAKVGVFPMQVLVHLRRLLLPRHVNELCLTGQLLPATRAAEIGLVNHVVEPNQLDEAVEKMLAHLSLMSASALRRGKAVIAAMETMSFEGALAFAEAQIALASRTSDANEGVTAFVEKRNPRWTPSKAG